MHTKKESTTPHLSGYKKSEQDRAKLKAMIIQIETFCHPESDKITARVCAAVWPYFASLIASHLFGKDELYGWFYDVIDTTLTKDLEFPDKMPVNLGEFNFASLALMFIAFAFANYLVYSLFPRQTAKDIDIQKAQNYLDSGKNDHSETQKHLRALEKINQDFLSYYAHSVHYAPLLLTILYTYTSIKAINTEKFKNNFLKALQYTIPSLMSVLNFASRFYALSRTQEKLKEHLKNIAAVVEKHSPYFDLSLVEHRIDNTLFTLAVEAINYDTIKSLRIPLKIPTQTANSILRDLLSKISTVHILTSDNDSTYLSYHSHLTDKNVEHIKSYMQTFCEKHSQVLAMLPILDNLLVGIVHRNILCTFIPANEDGLPDYVFNFDISKLPTPLVHLLNETLRAVFGQKNVSHVDGEFIKLSLTKTIAVTKKVELSSYQTALFNKYQAQNDLKLEQKKEKAILKKNIATESAEKNSALNNNSVTTANLQSKAEIKETTGIVEPVPLPTIQKTRKPSRPFTLFNYFARNKKCNTVFFPQLNRTVNLDALESPIKPGEIKPRKITIAGMQESNKILFFDCTEADFKTRHDFNSFVGASQCPIEGSNLKRSNHIYKGADGKKHQASYKIWRGAKDPRVLVSLEDVAQGTNGVTYYAYEANAVSDHKELHELKK